MSDKELSELLQASLATAYSKSIRLNKGEQVDLFDLHKDIQKSACEALELQRRESLQPK